MQRHRARTPLFTHCGTPLTRIHGNPGIVLSTGRDLGGAGLAVPLVPAVVESPRGCLAELARLANSVLLIWHIAAVLGDT